MPPIEIQSYIASILSTLDDKIELNRQTNQTLEAIAQAIYKEWFVNFRFPPSPLEGCPKGGVDTSPLEGWQAKPDGVDSSHTPPPSPASWQKNSLFPFWTLPKNRALQERAKELRKQGILSEVIFWKTFKDKKKLGWDIDRQVIIGNFIVDFFIPELGLVFEIDGSSHNDKQEYDRERDAFLSSLRLKVVRILGKDVLGNIEGVWGFVTRLIKERVEELSPPRPSGTPQEGKRCEMQDSELGPIPKGWRVVSLADLMEFQGGSQPPADQFKDGYHEGYIRLIQIRDYETDSHITYVPRTDKLRICEDKDIMIARYGASVGRVLFGLNGAYNVALVKVIPEKKHYREFLRLYLKSYSFQERLLAMSSRSAQAGFNKGDFKSFRIAFPQGDQLLIEFEKITACLIEKILINNLESEALANTRDKLLPKLMSGEIEVRVMK